MIVKKKNISSQVKSIRQVVYDTLKELILTGAVSPGEHLREREIAANFSVSTTPVKEALRRLEQEGLVMTKPRRGTYVSSRISDFMEEVSWARSALEGVAARLAAIKISDAEIEELRAQLEEMQRYTREGNAEKLVELNERFHLRIRDIAKNDYVEQQISAVRDFDRVVRKQALSNPEELERAYREHRFIFERIAERDPDGAEEAMRSHIRRTAGFVKTMKGSDR